MKFRATPEEQFEALTCGCAQIVSLDELKARLVRSCETGKPLVIKLGADPSAPDIHLGHTVVLQKLRQFQNFGHEVVFVIGDFTARIGDPTGKKKTRPSLSESEVIANAETYKAQIGKILDLEKTRVEFNSRWLAPMTFEDVLKLSAQYTVARMLERDDFSNRFKNQVPISVSEFMYPLMQGYDSVALKSDVELGGVDQTFNLLVGRELQRSYSQPPQVTITVPILEGLDGTDKMSKSLGNYVGVNEAPGQIYGKLMSLPDALMTRYFNLLTDLNPMKSTSLAQMISESPKEAKMLLARTITERFHDTTAAENAQKEFENMFGKSGDGLPDEIEEVRLAAGSDGIALMKLLTSIGMVASGSEARRLMQQGGVKVDRTMVTDPQTVYYPKMTILLQVGKRRFKRVTIDQQ